jgi:hypothetical protein
MSRLAEIVRSYEMVGRLLKSSQDADDINKLAKRAGVKIIIFPKIGQARHVCLAQNGPISRRNEEKPPILDVKYSAWSH